MVDDSRVPERADLDNWFSYHPPSGPSDVEAYQRIREAGRTFALVVLDLVPGSRERTNAWTAIREAVMWANAGRACNPLTDDTPASTTTRTGSSHLSVEAAADVRANLHGKRPL